MAPPKCIPSRRYWLDNIRGVMTTMVIIGHTAAAYGGGGTTPHSACFDKASPILLLYVIFNQAYGMGQFFWLSGHLTAQSLSKRSGLDFARSKLLRLGVPTLLYSIFLVPLQAIALRPRLEGDLRSNIKAYFKAVLDFKGWLAPGSGTVWYTATLLIFDLCSLLLKRCFHLFSSGRARSSEFSTLAKSYALLCRWGWLAVAGSRFLISTRFPLGKWLPVVNIQPYFIPQFIYGYVLGHMAFHLGKPRMSSLFEKQSQPLGKLSLAKATAISLATLPIVLLPRWLRARRDRVMKDNTKDIESPLNASNISGLSGWNSTAALFALWNEFTFNTLVPAWMSDWEQNHNAPGKSKLWSPRYAYAAYLLHSPISWFVGQGLDNLLLEEGRRPAWMGSRTWQDLGPMLTTGAASMIDVAASFGAGLLLIDYVPGADNIL